LPAISYKRDFKLRWAKTNLIFLEVQKEIEETRILRKEENKMNMGKKCLIILAGLVPLLGVVIWVAFAVSDYPSRSIEMVIPYPPGGGADIISGVFKDKVSKILGQPIVPIFKPGAAGAIGGAFVARAKPDGYTLLMTSTTPMILGPLTKRGTGYTLNDFAPVCNLSIIPTIWLVKDDGPYKTMQDFIQAAKNKKMIYTTGGPLSVSHLCMEALGKAAGFEAIHVPYEGVGKGLAAVLGGHADIGIVSGSLGMAGPGKLRVVAVAAKKRWEAFPAVPILEELGYPIYGMTYFSLFAPKGTPEEIAHKIYEAHKKVAEESKKQIEESLKVLEHTVLILSPEELWKVYQEDFEFQKKNLKEMGKLLE
jgi:tripartite-type tricarboxylate transporter receptor subunit TctC